MDGFDSARAHARPYSQINVGLTARTFFERDTLPETISPKPSRFVTASAMALNTDRNATDDAGSNRAQAMAKMSP